MVGCVGADQRDAENEGRSVKAGRKAVIRGAENAGARKPPNPPRPKAEASVETRQELPSAASAVTARTEVRVIIVSVNTRCVDSHLPLRSPDHGCAFALRRRVYNSFTDCLQAGTR